jgi:hypothetical protein
LKRMILRCAFMVVMALATTSAVSIAQEIGTQPRGTVNVAQETGTDPHILRI